MKIDYNIRAARPEDAEGICLLQGMPGYRAGTLRLPYPTIQSVRERLQKPDPEQTLLVAEGDGQILGHAGLTRYAGRRSHVGQIGMGVRDDYAGRGIGTALLAALIEVADRWLALRRVELEVFVDNEAAIALYGKFGFEQEGILRDYAFRDGHYVDAFAMARLRR
jgi:putative acetyltransferase